MFCFDNTFSTISEKVIFFELILDNMGEQEQEQEDWKKYVTGTDMLDMKLEDILESINSIKSRLSKSGHIQTMLRAFEARDRNIQESNFDRGKHHPQFFLSLILMGSSWASPHSSYSPPPGTFQLATESDKAMLERGCISNIAEQIKNSGIITLLVLDIVLLLMQTKSHWVFGSCMTVLI
ncbi:transmembrane emp24 domain-containing protein 5 [Phascolarctos cinereus]